MAPKPGLQVLNALGSKQDESKLLIKFDEARLRVDFGDTDTANLTLAQALDAFVVVVILDVEHQRAGVQVHAALRLAHLENYL